MNLNHAAEQGDGWETIASETCFETDHLRVAQERVRSPARAEGRDWTVVHRKAAVVIAAMTAERKLVLIRQERIPIRTAIWEMPAGQIDHATGESIDLSAVALRELREETGYELAASGELIPLGDFFSSPGFTDERSSLFLARPVKPGPDGPAHDDAETILDCREFDFHEIGRMIATNEIRDANTLSVCARLVARGLISLRA
ncbi:MAG: NUDIX hydrolase [Verrucomicrobiota bacterium]|nr:NUDIX hydrolase [Verrucomicrobiota bacterium]